MEDHESEDEPVVVASFSDCADTLMTCGDLMDLLETANLTEIRPLSIQNKL